MKKANRTLLIGWYLVFLIGVVIWIPLLKSGLPYTHDGENHLARFANYYLALKEGQIPPRFAPNLMNRYGYPVFNYNYPLASILSVPLTVINVNLEMTYKLMVIACLVWGGLGVWQWLAIYRFTQLSRWLSILAYWSAPYVLSAVFFRGSIGEVLVYGLLPWIMWWVGRFGRSPTKLLSVFGGVLIALLLLAHNVTGILGLGLIFLITLIEWGKSRQVYQKAGLSLLIGLGLSLWFWLPAIAESQQVVVLSAGIQKEFLNHLVTTRQLMTSPLSFGYSTTEPVDGLSMSVGTVAIFTIWLALLIWLVVLIYRLKDKIKIVQTNKLVSMCLFTVLTLLFLQTNASVKLWSLAPVFQIIQFPWRLMLFVPILILPILAWVWDRGWWTTRILLVVGIIIQVWIASNLQVVDRFHKTNEDYLAFTQSTSTQNENRPVGFNYDQIGDWQPTPTVWEGEAKIEVKKWRGSFRQYLVDAQTDLILIEPTAYFLGWQTQAVDLATNHKQKLNYYNSDQVAGRIAIQLPAGQYLITTRFTQQTPARYIGNGIFILTLALILFIIIKHRQRI